MTNSLFRIDRNSLTDAAFHSAEVVVIPGLEDMPEAIEEPPAQEEAEPEQRQSKAVAGKIDDVLEEKKAELQQLQQSIEDIKKQAGLILEGANSKAAEIEQSAQDHGFEQGLARARAEIEQQRRQEQQEVREALATIGQAKEQIFDQVECSVLDLAFFIAEHILKTELDRKEEVFQNLLRDTLAGVRSQNDIVVRVSRNEYERFFAQEDSELKQSLRNSGITVKQDLSMKNGDCVVETEYGTISSGIRTQLKRMGYALREAE